VTPIPPDSRRLARNRPPTERQLRALRMIGRRIRLLGEPPTQPELAQALGLRQVRSLRSRIVGLELRGLLTRNLYTTRGLRPTEDGWRLIDQTAARRDD